MSVKLRKRTLPSGKVQFYLSIGDSKQRRYETLKLTLTKDKAKNKEILLVAEAARSTRELDLVREANGLKPKVVRKKSMFTYTRELIADKHPRNQLTYKNMLKHLKAFNESEELFFGQITERFCERFKNHLLTKLNPNSALAYFLRLRSVLKAAEKDELIVGNPTADIKIKHKKSLPRYLTEQELQRLATTPCGNKVTRDAFLFSCLCGLRYEDISKLVWSQIKNKGIEIVQSKTGDPLRIPLTPEALEILERQKKIIRMGKDGQFQNDGRIFDLPRRSSIDKVLKTWGKRANIRIPISMHKGRHTFATMLLSSGTDIYTASKLLGHRDIATTTIYAKVVDQKKEEAINRLPSIGI
jgi:integrase